MLVAPGIEAPQVPRQPEEEPQLLDAQVGPGQMRVPPPGVGGLDERFQHVHGRALDAVAEQELVGTGKAGHRGDHPQDEAEVRFQRRAGLPRMVLASLKHHSPWTAGPL